MSNDNSSLGDVNWENILARYINLDPLGSGTGLRDPERTLTINPLQEGAERWVRTPPLPQSRTSTSVYDQNISAQEFLNLYGGGNQQHSQQSINMNGNFDIDAQSQVMGALNTLRDYLPRAFGSSAAPVIDINGALAPLIQQISDLRIQLADINQKYEEVLYRLETNELAAQEMTT